MARIPAKAQGVSQASLRRMFDEYQSMTQEARTASEVDLDYYHSIQWTAAERRVLRTRKQPDNVFNRVRQAINGTLGVIKQGATDPRAYPRNPGDDDAADVASKTLRFIADLNRFSSLKGEVSLDYLVQGTGAAIVEVDADLQVTVEQIRWEEFFHDPRARRKDFADARYLGVAKWMYADDVAGAYPDLSGQIESALEGGGSLAVSQSFEDRPRNGASLWVDRRKRRLLVVEVYYREAGAWNRCVFYAGGELSKGASPYLDAKGKPCCPIEAQSCYVDRDNNRYGLVRDMRGPQDEINKRRSKLLHLLSVSQIQARDASAIEVNADEARAEAARPDGVIPFGWEKVPTTDRATGEAMLLQEAKSEIERMGPNPAILGRQGEGSSGRAQMIRQQAGLTEQAIIFGGIEDWELRIYRQMWARARQYWTAPAYVRTTDDQKAPEFIGINQPIMGEQVVQVYDEMTGQVGYANQPAILGYENAIGEMDVDIILDTTPDTANLQQEQFMALVDLARAGVPIPPQVLLEASALPNKRSVIEKLEKASADQAQQPDPAKDLAMRGAAAKVAETEAKARKTGAEADQTEVETQNALVGRAMNTIEAFNGNAPVDPGQPY